MTHHQQQTGSVTPTDKDGNRYKRNRWDCDHLVSQKCPPSPFSPRQLLLLDFNWKSVDSFPPGMSLLSFHSEEIYNMCLPSSLIFLRLGNSENCKFPDKCQEKIHYGSTGLVVDWHVGTVGLRGGWWIPCLLFSGFSPNWSVSLRLVIVG